MKPMVEFSELALDDINEVWFYISKDSVDAAERSMFEFQRKFDLLARNPLVGTSRDDLIVGLQQFPHKNYNIFYFHTENGVEIYRVLHGSRDTVQMFDDSIDTRIENI